MNGALFSQLGIVELRDFDGCLREMADGRTAEVMIVLIERSLWVKSFGHQGRAGLRQRLKR
jgi:hypothetical protein